MRMTDGVLALAAAVALGGLGPMAYMLSRQLFGRRARKATSLQLDRAREVLAGSAAADIAGAARALSVFDVRIVDRTIEQLASESDGLERQDWIGRLATQVGLVERCCERARNGTTWNERAQAVRVLGHLGVAGTVSTLARVLRDRDEDDTVRSLAADALAAMKDEGVVPLLVSELRQVDEQATPRVAEALIRFGQAATPALIELLGDKEHTPARVWAARILAATRDPKAVEALLGSLRDRHDALRAASAEALGHIADPRALKLLLQVSLRDPAPLVRAQAAVAASQVSGPEAADVLIATLSDPDYATRLRGLEAFENMRLSDTTALEKALNDTNTEVQRRAALALERLGYLDRLVEGLVADDRATRTGAYGGILQLGRAGLVEGIVGRISHESMQVRTAIARVCGELGVERAGPILVAALGDPAWPVRAALCESIGQLRPSGGGRALVPMLADPEESVREAAASGISAYAGAEIEEAHDALRTAYEHGSIPIRLAMIAVAACPEGSAMSQILVDALRDPSEAVRLRAVGALVVRPDPAATPALIAALTDASIEVRLAAVPALGASGTAESFEALLRALSGAQPAFRERIAEALSGVGRHHLLRNIGELARSQSLDVRLGVAWTLGKIGDTAGVGVLCDFLRDQDPRLRASAAGALGKIPNADAVQALVVAVDDPDPKTRAAVVNALGKCGGHLGVDIALGRRLHDPDSFVRNRTGIALARAFGAEMAQLAVSPETARLLEDPALVLMQGLVGTADAVALALGALGDPARLPRIQEFFDREEPAICAAFLACLNLRDPASSGLNTRLDPAALSVQYQRLLLSSRDAGERRAAVEALAGIRGGGQATIFAQALGADPDDTVRLRCAEVLVRLRDDDVGRVALVRAASDPNPKVAVAAVEGLRAYRDPKIASVLFRRLGAGSASVNDAVEQVLSEIYRDDLVGFLDRTMGLERSAAMIAAIRVLELMGQKSAFPLLRELMKSEDPEVRAAAVRAMAKTGSPEARAMVAKMLDDPNELVRIATLEVTASEGPEALVRLAAARSDPSVAVRSKLCQLLENRSAAAMPDVIGPLLDDAAPPVRAAALVTLLACGDGKSLRRFSQCWTKAAPETVRAVRLESRAHPVTRKLLRLLASGGDSTARELAVVGIAALAVDGYEQLLLPVLRDPRVTVRLAATRALASSPAAEVRKQLSELATDPESAVREAVREALSGFGP